MPITLKEKLNDMIFSQNNNFAIHCPTNESAEVIVKTLYDIGFEWGQNQSLYNPDGTVDTKWANKKKETCYSVNNDSNIIFCARKAFYEKRYRRIVEYDDLISDVTIEEDKAIVQNPETSFSFDNTLNGSFNFEQPAATVEAPVIPIKEEVQPAAPKVDEPATVPCQHCGEMIKATVKFCRYCGQKQDRDFNPKSGELRRQFNSENNTQVLEVPANEDVFIPNPVPVMPVTEIVTPETKPITDVQNSGISFGNNISFDFNTPIENEAPAASVPKPVESTINNFGTEFNFNTEAKEEKQPVDVTSVTDEPEATVISENFVNKEEFSYEEGKNTDSIIPDNAEKMTLNNTSIAENNNSIQEKTIKPAAYKTMPFDVFVVTGLKVFEEFHIGTLPMTYRFNSDGLRECKIAAGKWILCNDEQLLITILTHPEYIHKIEGDNRE